MAQVKRIRRAVDGIILLDKPKGFSSNAALQKVRWLLNAEKAGHTGSLDPLATGVLPLCFGEATKFSQYLLDADKKYEAELAREVRGGASWSWSMAHANAKPSGSGYRLLDIGRLTSERQDLAEGPDMDYDRAQSACIC